MKVAVVTDSTASLPGDLVRELNIGVVPVLMIQGSETFRDGVDITPAEVYRRLRAGMETPTSAAPSVGDFLRVYEAAAQESSAIVSIHVASRLSTTYNVAVTASQQIGDVPIRVLDSETAAMAQGLVVLEAARAAAAGAPLDEVVARVEEVASRMHFLFTLDTFEYLRRSGRIGGAAALLGTALQIRPVLCLAEGRVDVFAKPRTKRRAIQLILQQMAERAEGRPMHVAIVHADVHGEAQDLQQVVAERFNCIELHVTEFTPVVGAHTGPGLLGVAFYVD